MLTSPQDLHDAIDFCYINLREDFKKTRSMTFNYCLIHKHQF